MSEERRDEDGATPRPQRVARLAVLLLLGALFLVLGGSRADAAEAPVASEVVAVGSALPTDALDTGAVTARVEAVGGAVSATVDPVVDATVEPVAPVVAPARPVVERTLPPIPTVPALDAPVLPVPDLPSPVLSPAPLAAESRAASAPGSGAAGSGRITSPTPGSEALATADVGPADPTAAGHRPAAPATSPASTTDRPAGASLLVAVLTAVLGVAVLRSRGITPWGHAPPLAPSFAPPVSPA